MSPIREASTRSPQPLPVGPTPTDAIRLPPPRPPTATALSDVARFPRSRPLAISRVGIDHSWVGLIALLIFLKGA